MDIIILENNENLDNTISEEIQEKNPVKRTRRTKKKIQEEANAAEAISNLKEQNNQDDNSIIQNEEINEPKVYKKRGRKPKGGKIIVNSTIKPFVNISEYNIILHLKCNSSDIINKNINDDNLISIINYIPYIQNVETFQFENNKNSDLIGFKINDNNNYNDNNTHSNSLNNNNINDNNTHSNVNDNNNISDNNSLNDNNTHNNSVNTNNINDNNSVNNNIKQLWNKIKELSINLHNNAVNDKKSDCFWCTCGFDNPPIYIPKFELNETYHCYGCFCSPECATAFLFKEPIDTSTRFERYHLLNHIYCKIYNYNKNIKPAPNPFYTLNKYYGNLSIQEYRILLKNERLLIIVEKPLSVILPELYEDNDEIIQNSSSVIASNKFSLKKRTKPTKKDYLNENFSLSSSTMTTCH